VLSIEAIEWRVGSGRKMMEAVEPCYWLALAPILYYIECQTEVLCCII
jgi:hypothetical protein